MTTDGARVTHAGLRAHSAEGTAGRTTPAGLVARSPEGTAAKGMPIKGHEDLWVEIQANTFRNWINEHLKPADMKVADLAEDLRDGTALCALVEALQGRRLRGWSTRPSNQHRRLENVTTALQAIEDDGVKLVNIGNVDIVNGNLKLILGLVWSLIVRYQIGRSTFPPRKLMLSWLQAALPGCRVANLTTDWNSGVLLSALVDYCKPGLLPHWKELNRHAAKENCTRAMRLAQRELGVPQVLEPEYLASPWLDELSGMTYLSYFLKPGSPGCQATLDWVNSRLDRPISNFTTDWNDGRVACELVRSLGGAAPAPARLRHERARWDENNQQAIDAARRLGVEPVLTAQQLTQSDVEHLGVMTWATHFRHTAPRPPLHDMLRVALDSTSGRVGEPMQIKIESLSQDLSVSELRTSIVNPLEQESRLALDEGGAGEFTPEHAGMHEVVLTKEDIRVDGRFFFRVLPRLVAVPPPGMAPCALGSLVEVLVSATGAPHREDIDVTAHAPSRRRVPLRARHPPPDAPGAAASSASFQPDEPGLWTIAITYKGEHIQGGPFTCEVFDPAGVRLSEGWAEGAQPLKPHSFELDTSGCGARGDLQLDIVHDKRSVMCALEKLSATRYRATFMPKAQGKHRLYVYFNGYDVKGSPHMFRVGSKGKSRARDSLSPSVARDNLSPSAARASPARASPVRVTSPNSRYRSESPMYQYDANRSKHYELNRESDHYETNSFTEKQHEKSYDITDSSYSSKTKKHEVYSSRYGSESPRGRTASPISPKNSSLDARGSSPYRATSPFGRNSPMLKNEMSSLRTASPVNRVDSPSEGYSPVTTTRQVVEKRSNYYHSSYGSGDVEDFGGAGGGDPGGPGRSLLGGKDSWDQVERTRRLLLDNSLDPPRKEEWRHALDGETRRNTQLNKYSERRDQRLLDERSEHSDTYESRQEYSKRETKQSYVVRDTSQSSCSVDEKQQQPSFLSNRPPRAPTGGAEDGDLAITEAEATRHRFRSNEYKKIGVKDVVITPAAAGTVGEPVELIVDGSDAGPGRLAVVVEEGGGGGRAVESRVRALGGRRYAATFTPARAGPHRVRVTFDGEPVQGTNLKVKWFAYRSFDFLVKKNRKKKSIKREDVESIEAEQSENNREEPTFAFEEVISDNRTEVENVTQDNLESIGHVQLSKPEYDNAEECYSFGNYVANKLRQYSLRARCEVQHAISDILYKADQDEFQL